MAALAALESLFITSAFVLALFLTPTRASTHWIVTEDGRIQCQPDSVFFLRKPYDLVALMQQEARATAIESLIKDLSDHSDETRQKEAKTSGDPVNSTEIDCQSAEHKLGSVLYEPVVPLLEVRGIRIEDYIRNTTASQVFGEPLCTKAFSLNFSMHAFEHLQAVRWRQNISLLPDIELVHLVVLMKDVAKFRQILVEALTENGSLWLTHLLAAYYFRLLGDGFNAIECTRRALHLAPRQFKDIPQLCLGNILHRARHTEEAAIVVHAAVDLAPHIPANHYLLGNIYAAMSDFNRSTVCYTNTLQLDPRVEAAAQRLRAIHCYSKLEKDLASQLGSLQQTWNQLTRFEKDVEFLHLRIRLIQEQAPLEERFMSQVHYTEAKIRQKYHSVNVQETVSLTDKKGCVQVVQNGLTFLSCGGLPKLAIGDVHILQQMLREYDPNTVLTDEEDNEPSVDMSSMESLDWSAPTLHPTYPKVDNLWSLTNDAVIVQSRADIISESCQGKDVRRLKRDLKIPRFLPPENKGFEVTKFLGELQGLQRGQQHLRPWHQPMCESTSESLSPGDDFMLPLDKIASEPPTTRKQSETLTQGLLRYIQDGPSTRAEFGQRLFTAISKSLGPKWLLHTLSALYWLAEGNMNQTVHCLRSTLGLTPKEYLDVPLVALASLLHLTGYTDEAISAAWNAQKINEYEPVTNILLAELHLYKNNITSAMYHYRKALQQDPDNSEVLEQLQHVVCQLRGGMETPKPIQSKGSKSRKSRDPQLNMSTERLLEVGIVPEWHGQKGTCKLCGV